MTNGKFLRNVQSQIPIILKPDGRGQHQTNGPARRPNQNFVLRRIEQLESTKEAKEKDRKERSVKANKNRSVKNRRNWRYWKSIQENFFPEKSLKEIRSSFKKHKEGLDTDIADVVWRNPSP